jgi:hypothetical protein
MSGRVGNARVTCHVLWGVVVVVVGGGGLEQTLIATPLPARAGVRLFPLSALISISLTSVSGKAISVVNGMAVCKVRRTSNTPQQVTGAHTPRCLSFQRSTHTFITNVNQRPPKLNANGHQPMISSIIIWDGYATVDSASPRWQEESAYAGQTMEDALHSWSFVRGQGKEQ